MIRASDYTTAQVYSAISAALQADDMPAVVALLHVLAVKDPRGAQAIVAMVEAMSASSYSRSPTMPDTTTETPISEDEHLVSYQPQHAGSTVWATCSTCGWQTQHDGPAAALRAGQAHEREAA